MLRRRRWHQVKKQASGCFLRSTRPFVSFPTEDVMIEVCVPQAKHNLQRPLPPTTTPPPPFPHAAPTAFAHHTLHGTQLIIAHANYVSWCEEKCQRCSVPVVRQINKCLMTRSVAPTNPFGLNWEGGHIYMTDDCERSLFVRSGCWLLLHAA